MRLLLLSVVALCLAGAAAPAEEHAIKLDRLLEAGNILEVISAVEQSGHLESVLSRPRREGVHGDFTASGTIVVQITIEEIDTSGWATKAKLKVIRCDMKTTNMTGRGLGKAALIEGKTYELGVRDGQRLYLERAEEANGAYVLGGFYASMLDMAVPLRFMKGEKGMDAMFGTSDPQQSGAEWQAGTQAIAEGFAYLGASKDKTQGKAVLKQVKAQAKTKLLTVEAMAQIDDFKHKFDLQTGYVPGASKLELIITGTLPADPTALPVEQTIKQNLTIEGTNAKRQNETEWVRESGRARYKLLK